MRLRVVIPIVLSLVAAVGLLLAVAVFAMAGKPAPADGANPINIVLSIGFAATIAAVLAAWGVLHLYLIGPLAALAREARSLAVTPGERELFVPRKTLVAGVVASVDDLANALLQTRSRTDAAIATATKTADEQRRRLEAILLDLTEGVIVCNRDHRIILYNESARRILGLREMTGLGRSLFGVLAREPVLHTLEILRRSDAVETAGDGGAPVALPEQQTARRFMVSTVDLGTLIETRMSLIREGSGEVSGYVLSFQDIGAQIESLSSRDSLLREVMFDWRRPIANLTAAIETFASGDELTPGERAGFDDILRKEISVLRSRFDDAAKRFDRLDTGHWGIADVHSLDLFRAVTKHVAAEADITISLVGLPMWISADSHALTVALAHLIEKLSVTTGQKRYELGVTRGDHYTYVEIGWAGELVRDDVLDQWLDQPLEGALASRTARQIIERHGGEIWSTSASDGTALLRLPLRPADRSEVATAASTAGPRPEYYDFDLFRSSPASLADARLRELRFVVFDTETTGLQPSLGDELLSIGAVQVVNGRLLTGETFERLVDPERDIPALSTRIHGITEDMVKGKPPTRIVLPQFRAFVGDAVLVAYNIAFDMKFLTKRQEEAGVVFDNPVLDALLLAIHLFPDHPDPSLTSMANYLGIEVTGRHTATGDALVTAAVWLRLIEGLEKEGVTTFGAAVAISDRMLQERRLADKF